jgi:hypothetical protein
VENEKVEKVAVVENVEEPNVVVLCVNLVKKDLVSVVVLENVVE